MKIRNAALYCLFAITAPVLAGACSDDDGGGDVDAAPMIDAAPADAGTQAVTIDFAVKVGTEEAACTAAAPYAGLGSAGISASLNDIRFYVSNVRLLSGTQEAPVTLDQDGTWQYMDVALLDFEDGTGGCATNGNAATNSQVVGTVPPGTYDGISFDLGVPYALNHQDVTTVPSPLNVMAMYWAWAIGHKFLRVDFAIDGGGAWNVHLGSHMCDSPNPPSDPPDSGCGKPNRARITLTGFDPAANTAVLDLAKLVEDSDLSANAGMAPGCQSFPDDGDDCTPLYPNLGLDFSTGDCVNGCQDQSAFRVE